MKIPVHDNFIVSYEVQCERREIFLHTEFRDQGMPFERTVVVFTNVEAYHFQHDCFGNIVFGIEEVPVEIILNSRLTEFVEGNRLSGWPRFWKESLDEVRSYLREQATRGFELSSSCGMSGWVLARDMQIVKADGTES